MIFYMVFVFFMSFSFVKCSSILTKDMIRISENSSGSFPGTNFTKRFLPRPAALTSENEDFELEIIHPYTTTDSSVVANKEKPQKHVSYLKNFEDTSKLDSIRQSTNISYSPGTHFPGRFLPKPAALTSETGDSELEIIHTYTTTDSSVVAMQEKSHKPVNYLKRFDNSSKLDTIRQSTSTSYPIADLSVPPTLKPANNSRMFNEFGERNSSISPKELSRKYWIQYSNFSQDFFTKPKSPHHDSNTNEATNDRQYPQTNFLEILQNTFQCAWTSGLVSCLQDNFGNSSSQSVPYYQFLMQSFPHQQVQYLRNEDLNIDNEESSSRNDKYDFGSYDQEEARRKLSKKIQLLVPFLLMIKMSMLPALAVMALVSGKAFLLSLVSLGVALFAITLPTPFSTLSASKRHEVAPQSLFPSPSPSTADLLPSKYYYAM